MQKDAGIGAPPTASCLALLKDVGVACPLHPGAPALGHAALTVLASALVALGAVMLQRHA